VKAAKVAVVLVEKRVAAGADTLVDTRAVAAVTAATIIDR
jgi:hypothetical protein